MELRQLNTHFKALVDGINQLSDDEKFNAVQKLKNLIQRANGNPDEAMSLEAVQAKLDTMKVVLDSVNSDLEGTQAELENANETIQEHQGRLTATADELTEKILELTTAKEEIATLTNHIDETATEVLDNHADATASDDSKVDNNVQS